MLNRTLCLSHVYHATNTITLLHDIERLVNILQSLSVSDKLIDLELALHVVINQIWELSSTFNATKSRSTPNTSSDKLKC